MFIGWILKKMAHGSEKRRVIREVISRLRLEKPQEQLYLESLDVLDNEHLDMFYRKLVALIDIIEERDAMTIGDKKQSQISNIRTKEKKEREENTGNFNILFDNI